MTGRPRVRRRVRPRDDSGQLLLVVLLYTLVAAGLVVVATDAAALFLHRRALASAADGAAVAAVQAADEAAIYTGGYPGGSAGLLPVDAAAARATVAAYVADNALPARFPGFAVRSVEADGRSVTVTLTSRVPLPFVRLLGREYAGGVRVGARARARAPLVTAP